jgi:DNA-binding CsgD family transcriptional regulator/AraC-like DNA-binding protein
MALVFPYLRDRPAAIVEPRLRAGDFVGLRRLLRARRDDPPDPELDHVLGLIEYFYCEFETALTLLERSFLALRRAARNRAAALVAVSLGRVYFDGLGDQLVGRGWLRRAHSLVDGEPPCVEQGWVELGLVGCSVADAGALHDGARLAINLARVHGDSDLECKALADGGLARVSLGRVAEGMAELDEAMTMLQSGECANPIVAAQVVCDLLSACERAGDLSRAERWIHAAEARRIVGPVDQRPSFTFTHCRIAYGSILCELGRWGDAETALRLGLATARTSGQNQRTTSRAALADLWIRQGRFEAAEHLLEGEHDRVEALAPLARLHLARGRHALAASVSRRALRLLGEDRLRAAPLLLVVVESELRSDNVDAAEAASTHLAALAVDTPAPMVAAQAALAIGHIAKHRGDNMAAARAYESGVDMLSAGDWPLLRAGLRLRLAEVQAEVEPAAAVVEARAALAVYVGVGSPEAERAASLWRRLGQPDRVRSAAPTSLDTLTRREREVFDLLADQLTNPEIGRRLGVTAKTVEHHVSMVLSKLGLRGRAEAAVYAITLD